MKKIFIIILFLLLAQNVRANVLSDAAAALSPGQWTTITTNNFTACINHAPDAHDGNIMPFANNFTWDNVRHQGHFVGMDHGNNTLWYVKYDADSNTWSCSDPQVGSGHGYDNTEVDPGSGTVYHKLYDTSGGIKYKTISDSYFANSLPLPPTFLGNFMDYGMAWWTGPLDGNTNASGALFLWAQSFAILHIYDPTANSWFYDSGDLSGLNGWITGYQVAAAYSPVYNVAVFGGGCCNANPTKIWKFDQHHNITALATSPIGIGTQIGNFTVDPVSGNFLIRGNHTFYELNPTGTGTYRQLPEPPSYVGNANGSFSDDFISAPIPEYGVVMYISCMYSAGPCTVAIYKHADDFSIRCVGALRCIGFEDPNDIVGGYGDNHGLLKVGYSVPERDCTTPAPSGNCSLKFTIPASMADWNPAGDYFINFSDKLDTQFDGSTGKTDFYIQFRYRVDDNFFGQFYTGGGGQKIANIGAGDLSGCSSGNQNTPPCFSSCNTLELVPQNTNQRGFLQMYNGCPGSVPNSSAAFEAFFNFPDITLQNARPSPYCLISQEQTVPKTFFPPEGNCVPFFPNEWMTIKIHVHIGPRTSGCTGNNGTGWCFSDSHVWVYLAREGQASQLLFDWTAYNLNSDSPASGVGFGKIWLTTAHTGSAGAPLAAHAWYDELIISTQDIPDPAASTSIGMGLGSNKILNFGSNKIFSIGN